MTTPKRILLVDDVLDWRKMLMGLLSEEGYQVQAAGSVAEAQQLFAKDRFHLAVLDVRLDETDEGNTEGLDLMYHIKRIDPTVTVIILTGYANVDMVKRALGPSEDGTRLAFSLVEKEEIGTRLLPDIEKAFRSEIKINYTLHIEGDEFLAGAVRKLRFTEKHLRTTEEGLIEEVEELFRRLFFDCEYITVQPLSQGHGGTAVVRIWPSYRHRGSGEAVVVKFGERSQIEQEALIYETQVKGIVGGGRLPQKLDLARTRTLAAIIYSFVGASLDEVRDFATLYREEEIQTIEVVLENVFRETCFPRCRDRRIAKDIFYFTSHYQESLNLRQTALETVLTKMLGSKRNSSFEIVDEGERLKLVQSNVFLPNPVWFVRRRPLFCSTYLCIVHGDLNGWNILVDRHNDAWLIDFARTGEGHILQDFASLESFVKFSLLTTSDLSVLYDWEKGLLASTDFGQPAELPDAAGNQDLIKASETANKIRQLAYEAKGEHDMKEYYLALLFNALKALTILDLPRPRREHALVSAALICESLTGPQ